VEKIRQDRHSMVGPDEKDGEEELRFGGSCVTVS